MFNKVMSLKLFISIQQTIPYGYECAGILTTSISYIISKMLPS